MKYDILTKKCLNVYVGGVVRGGGMGTIHEVMNFLDSNVFRLQLAQFMHSLQGT